MNGTKEINIKRVNKGLQEETLDSVIEEIPLEIFVNHEFYAALMCTPLEVKALAIGFLFSEGVLTSINSINSIEEKYDNRICIVLDHEINTLCHSSRAITSGCGNGSVRTILLEEGSVKPIDTSCKFNALDILKLMSEFNSKSGLFKQTGGVHSCCICSNNSILVFSEDIGRHNALDKVVGKAMLSNVSLKDNFIMTTGRISSDMVVKVAKVGIQLIVSHSAPTTLAINIAKAANITIIGFARGSRMNVYSCEYRIY